MLETVEKWIGMGILKFRDKKRILQQWFGRCRVGGSWREMVASVPPEETNSTVCIMRHFQQNFLRDLYRLPVVGNPS